MTNEALMAKDDTYPSYVEWCVQVQQKADHFSDHIFRIADLHFDYQSRYRDRVSVVHAARDLVILAKDIAQKIDHSRVT